MVVEHVVTSINEESSGVTQTTEAICNSLASAGVDVTLHCLEPLNRDVPFKCEKYHRSRFPNYRLARSPEMLGGLKLACRAADIVHINGLWQFPNVYPLWAREGSRCKLVVQPHGTLSREAMKYSKLIKFLFGHMFQYEVLRKAEMFVATSRDEFNDIRRLGYKQPVVILPNGVSIPNTNLYKHDNKADVHRRRMFFLSRIHPKKNVEMLIRCWARLEADFCEWDLSIVGPNKNNPYADEMKSLAEELGCKRVTFEGELTGDDKYRFIAESDCEVLPTHSENFGMVVAEALACGTPVICSYGAPWEGLVKERCGWWVPTEELAIQNAMREAMSLSRNELLTMGERGREWMRRDYDWGCIGRQMKSSYEWLMNPGNSQRPKCITTDLQ